MRKAHGVLFVALSLVGATLAADDNAANQYLYVGVPSSEGITSTSLARSVIPRNMTASPAPMYTRVWRAFFHAGSRNELTPFEIEMYSVPEGRSLGDRGAVHGAGVDVRDAELRRDALPLRSLARARGAQDDDVERHVAPYFRKPS